MIGLLQVVAVFLSVTVIAWLIIIGDLFRCFSGCIFIDSCYRSRLLSHNIHNLSIGLESRGLGAIYFFGFAFNYLSTRNRPAKWKTSWRQSDISQTSPDKISSKTYNTPANISPSSSSADPSKESSWPLPLTTPLLNFLSRTYDDCSSHCEILESPYYFDYFLVCSSCLSWQSTP